MTVTTVRHSAVEIAEMLGRPAPTPEQVEVIEAPLEPLLVVAGAGSGKTETMSARVVYLVANGLVEPERVLGLTFTRKAAGELSDRVRHRLRALRRVLGGLGDGAPSGPSREGPGAGAAGDGRARASVLLAPTISTYNAYAAGLVGDHAVRLGLEPAGRLLGEAARWQLAHEVVEGWLTDLGVDLAPTTVTEAVLDLAGDLAEHLRAPEDLRAETRRLLDVIEALPPGERLLARDRDAVRELATSLRLRHLLADLVEDFTARKRRSDAIDFADQVALAARLAREVPEVAAGERARFGVVLLDEYQDTSVAQLDLLGHLFGGLGEGAGHPVTAVGDPHQSIYGWRGASAGSLARFPSQFPTRAGAGPSRPARTAALATSWRNDRAVLAAANVVAEPLRTASVGGVHRLDLPVLEGRPDAGPGSVTIQFLPTQEDEARLVAEVVRAAWSGEDARPGGAGVTGGGPADGARPTVAVLCRTRSQFPLLQAALVAEGVPVEVVGLGGLLGTPEVVDLVAALEAAHDPSRGDSLMRLLTGPRARLGLADLHALGDWSAELASGTHRGAGPRTRPEEPADVTPEADVVDERSLVDALDELPRPGWTSRHGRCLTDVGRQRLVDLAVVLRAIRAQTFLPVVDLVAEAERLLGLDIEVASRPGRSPAGARANLDAFRSVAASFTDSTDTGTLGAFLAWLDAAQREERGLEAPVADVDPDAVQLMTVHAAKGLEWDVVAVPGLVDGTFPSVRRSAEGDPVDAGWSTDRGALPSSLRGDRESLPDLDVALARDLPDLAARLGRYRVESGAHAVAEERRLAYVALTRARRRLLLTGSWWRDGTTPRSPSPFLRELAEALPELVVEPWAPDPSAPGPDGTRTRPVKPSSAAGPPPSWPPASALGDRQSARDRAAEAVRAARSAALHHPAGEPLPPGPFSDLAAVTELLLDERRRGSVDGTAVPLPPHLSTSAVVRLASGPADFALELRRPVPTAPSVHARRGTAFHAWVESYYGSAALLDVDALPGADDDSVPADADLGALQATFLASPWAAMAPLAVEVDVETPIGGVAVRSRIDAVFADPRRPGGVVVVDWKTGRPPTGSAEREARELQLAVYRLAWSRRAQVPLDDVDAALFYASTGETVRPQRLLGEEEIERLMRPTTPDGGGSRASRGRT